MSRFGAFFADRLSVLIDGGPQFNCGGVSEALPPACDYSSREKYQNYRMGIQAPAGNSMGKKLPIFWLNVFPFSHVYKAVDKFNYLLFLLNIKYRRVCIDLAALLGETS